MVSIQTNSYISFDGMSGASAGVYSGRLTSDTPVNERQVSGIKTENRIRLFRAQIQLGTDENVAGQTGLFHFNRLSEDDKVGLIYEDRFISDLSTEEAKELISSDGYFGVDKTSQRITDFVLMGAGGDVTLLKAGREGILKGFDEAEKAWGGKLPEISYDTLAKSLEAIDEKMACMTTCVSQSAPKAGCLRISVICSNPIKKAAKPVSHIYTFGDLISRLPRFLW
jgi:hypothetical protein